MEWYKKTNKREINGKRYFNILYLIDFKSNKKGDVGATVEETACLPDTPIQTDALSLIESGAKVGPGVSLKESTISKNSEVGVLKSVDEKEEKTILIASSNIDENSKIVVHENGIITNSNIKNTTINVKSLNISSCEAISGTIISSDEAKLFFDRANIKPKEKQVTIKASGNLSIIDAEIESDLTLSLINDSHILIARCSVSGTVNLNFESSDAQFFDTAFVNGAACTAINQNLTFNGSKISGGTLLKGVEGNCRAKIESSELHGYISVIGSLEIKRSKFMPQTNVSDVGMEVVKRSSIIQIEDSQFNDCSRLTFDFESIESGIAKVRITNTTFAKKAFAHFSHYLKLKNCKLDQNAYVYDCNACDSIIGDNGKIAFAQCTECSVTGDGKLGYSQSGEILKSFKYLNISKIKINKYSDFISIEADNAETCMMLVDVPYVTVFSEKTNKVFEYINTNAIMRRRLNKQERNNSIFSFCDFSLEPYVRQTAEEIVNTVGKEVSQTEIETILGYFYGEIIASISGNNKKTNIHDDACLNGFFAKISTIMRINISNGSFSGIEEKTLYVPKFLFQAYEDPEEKKAKIAKNHRICIV